MGISVWLIAGDWDTIESQRAYSPMNTPSVANRRGQLLRTKEDISGSFLRRARDEAMAKRANMAIIV